MSRVLITVVGPRRRANLAVPFECPINDLMSGLVERCGEDTNGHNGDGGGREWAISRSDARLLPPDRSLQDCGITDGAILYLRPASVGDSQPLDVPAVDGGRAPSRAWTRSVLPERRPLRARLSQVAHAVLSSGSAAPIAMADPGDESPSSPEALTVHRAPTPQQRGRAAWRSSDYIARLDGMIASPRLRRCVTLAVMSPKGGVGKTTVTALLGTLLAHLRRDRVVAVDTNPDFGSLGRSLTPGHTIFVDDILYMFENPAITVTSLDAALGRGPHGLMVLPAPTDPARMARLDEEAYGRVIRRLQDLVGVVVLDCGTGLQEPAAQAAIKNADEIILVSDAEPATASIVAEAAQMLAHTSSRLLLVVNKMPNTGRRLNIDALARCVPQAKGMVLVPADVKAASRLCAGDFDWGDAPRGWVTATRELAAVLLTDWRDLGLAS